MKQALRVDLSPGAPLFSSLDEPMRCVLASSVHPTLSPKLRAFSGG